MRYIAAFFWTAAIDLAFCSILQQRYINYHNIRVLAALDLAIAVLYKPTTINIPFCSILQRRYIKLPQYISFCGAFLLLIAVGWMLATIDTFLQRFFLVIVAVWTAAIDLLIANAWSSVSLCDLSAIVAFHFPYLFIFQCIPLLLALRKKKPSLSFSPSLSLFV